MSPVTRSALCALLLSLQPHIGTAQDSRAEAAIDAARRGGTTILCRHAATDSFDEREPIDYGDPSEQRRLSREGERQSRTIGRALEARGIQVAELIASPMDRARRTAYLMFGREPAIDSIWHTNDGDYDGPARERRADVLATPPTDGNRLVVSHVSTMKSVLPGRLRIREGDCVVVSPTPRSEPRYRVLGVVPWRLW